MILIGADFVPTESNKDLFSAGDSLKLFGEDLDAMLKEADFRIFNLETPLCDNLSPIPKAGANFAAPSVCVYGYTAAHTDLLTLANNHILDQDAQGLESTWDVLKSSGIDTVGTGKNVTEASEPYFFDCFGKRIGVYACAEHEFSIAGKDSAGANPFDPLESPDHIRALKEKCDYVIVLYHGGKEYYRYPSPLLQKTCRKLIDKGADLVICQHSHCIGCEERYQNGVIVYGQGNFLFDISKREAFQTSVLIGVDNKFRIRYFPLIQVDGGVRLAKGKKADEIMEAFERRSREIAEEGFIEKKYDELAEQMRDTYLFAVSGKKSMLFRALNKLSGYRLNRLVLKKYGSAEKTLLLNYTECEAHRELLIRGLRR